MQAEALKQYIVEKIGFVMSMTEAPWFYCFGKMQQFIMSQGKNFDLNYDIDIGVIQEKTDMTRLQNMWESNEFKLKSSVINDVTGDPLNMHFVPIEHDLKGCPAIDILSWVRKGNKLYHTYDVHRERQQIPKEYVFKGVPAKFIQPDIAVVDEIRKKDTSLRADGTWEYSAFGEHSANTFRLPFAYGSLMDIWYPGWLFPAQKNIESDTIDIIKVGSCGLL